MGLVTFSDRRATRADTDGRCFGCLGVWWVLFQSLPSKPKTEGMCDAQSVEELHTVYSKKVERMQDLVYGLRWLESQTKARLLVLESQLCYAQGVLCYYQDNQECLPFHDEPAYHRVLCEAKIHADELEDEIFVETAHLYKIGLDVALEEGRLNGLLAGLRLTPAYLSAHQHDGSTHDYCARVR
jgi:hypothetical protein